MSFHYFRRSFWPGRSLINRIWSYHDRNPLPPAINLRIRSLLFLFRKISFRVKAKQKRFIYGNDNSLKAAPRLYILKSKPSPFLKDNKVIKRFEQVHAINETLRNEEGAWVPQPLVEYYGKGISIEEIALRIRGYLAAYLALKNVHYLDRAKEGCAYLIKKRIFKDGHIYLQGHITQDIPYAFAGEALLCLWKLTPLNTELLENAKKIGNRLIEYHIAGSVNHAVIPVQFLGQLYQVTGKKKYLKNCIKRMFRSAVPYQLSYGGWLGHESWIWYHALILRSLVIGYVSLPNTLEYYAKKDKLACSIIAAINRFISEQDEDGAFPMRPPDPVCEHKDDNRFLEQKAIYTAECGFEKINDKGVTYGSWNGYVIDALVTTYELLDTKELLPSLNRYAQNIAASNYVWRLEFDTLGAGRLLEYSLKLLIDKKDKLHSSPASKLSKAIVSDTSN